VKVFHEQLGAPLLRVVTDASIVALRTKQIAPNWKVAVHQP